MWRGLQADRRDLDHDWLGVSSKLFQSLRLCIDLVAFSAGPQSMRPS